MEIKGFTYGYQAEKGMYASEKGVLSRNALMDIAMNWVCLAFPVEQKTFASTEILFDYRTNIPDLELISTIEHFHSRKVKVCLKPMINCADGVWRALISFPDSAMNGEDSYWKAWFESYQAYLTHYAEIAEYTGCEMFCLGCEMLSTEVKEEYWRKTISLVRNVYSGPLVYNTNHGKEDKAAWYDEIDYLGTSAYYPVADKAGASKEEMVTVWEGIADQLEKISERLGKKVIFMEIGCRSALGCAQMPWDFMHQEFPFSEEEQSNFYASSLEVMSKREWFMGYFWWDWSTHIYETREQALTDTGFNIHYKKAEQVLRDWYQR